MRLQPEQAQADGWQPSSLAQLHRRLALLVVSGLLRQSLERIARLREVALIRLQQLLAQPATAAAVPGAAAIAAAVPEDTAELSCSGTGCHCWKGWWLVSAAWMLRWRKQHLLRCCRSWKKAVQQQQQCLNSNPCGRMWQHCCCGCGRHKQGKRPGCNAQGRHTPAAMLLACVSILCVF